MIVVVQILIAVVWVLFVDYILIRDVAIMIVVVQIMFVVYIMIGGYSDPDCCCL